MSRQFIPSKRWFLLFAAIVFILLFAIIPVIGFVRQYEGRAFPGIRIGNLLVGGKTEEEIQQVLQHYADQLPFVFHFKDKTIELASIITSPADPDITYDLVSFDVAQAVDQVMAIGREKSLIQNLIDQGQTSFFGRSIPLAVTVDHARVKSVLHDSFTQFETPAKDASLDIQNDGEISVIASETGYAFDYDLAISQLEQSLKLVDPVNIQLALIKDFPEISTEDATMTKVLIPSVLDNTPYQVNYQEDSWKLDQEILARWLQAVRLNGGVTLGLSSEAINQWFDQVDEEVGVEALDAKFTIDNGRVTEFQVAQAGQKIERDKSLQVINNLIFNQIKEAELVMEITEGKDFDEEINQFGVTELLGVGRSNFAGSPPNRRHNIKIGAAAVNGILIAPDEEFSLVKTLGEINASNGYLQELVIKGDRTIPEYGGGLCQIGTTIFRGVLDAGLPVTERRNHSYQVRYYEPTGTDATIYGPHPDFRFVNDTGKHVLIQTRIEGDELIFEYWGTSDGRKAETTDPVVYNWVPAPSTKYIETEDLEPGEQKCSEHAIPGADASFTYTVVYPDGEEKEEVFNSHYRPWQEICLVGKEKEEGEEGATEPADS